MGAQAAAALSSGLPLGVQRAFTPAVVERLAAPPGWRLDPVARAHGGIGLAPWGYDGQALTTVLPTGQLARVTADRTVELSAPADLTPLRRALALDEDLDELWSSAPAWLREEGLGWELRASSPFEALAQALASTNTSYRSTQAMLRELVGDGPFPAPAQVRVLPLARWGYRLPALRALAERVDDIDWDGLDDDAVATEVRALPGFGAFAAASALPLLGRPRPLVTDGWLAAQVDDVGAFARYGRWAGTVLWAAVSRRWRTPQAR